ncbi:MBL fold metallo-hydrolase RNA specificity domain-containing protein [Halobacteriovorax sp.]|uniref:MBL fold metallo-hydrolase RNA specificity domain-containing protein n=1 Tax=Halobacteriovorax sp. TaxID=2020862 RepID=UPI003AF1E7EB
MDNMKLVFYGATSTVTGSKTLLEINNKKVLVDSGMYQGDKDSTKKNQVLPNFNINAIDAIFLTHAHYDHCGYLPVLIKNGFKGKIYCTEGTRKIVELILRDSASIQAYEFKEGKSQSILYDLDDVDATLSHLRSVSLNKWYDKGFRFIYEEAGHILGAANITFDNGTKKICFSGDVGRRDDLIHNPPQKNIQANYLVLESTYGDRLHKKEDSIEILKKHIERIISTNGVLLIPAFAVARAQVLMYLMSELFAKEPQVKIPVYLDTPMGVRATRLYMGMADSLKVDPEQFNEAMKSVKFIEYSSDTKKLARTKKPFILISSSGMISGGKVLKYMEMYGKHENNTILITGFQGEGTIGRKLVEEEREIYLLGHSMEVKAHVEKLESLSAHADRDELIEFIQKVGPSLKKVFLNHGEEETVIHFAKSIEERLKIKTINVEDGKTYLLDS